MFAIVTVPDRPTVERRVPLNELLDAVCVRMRLSQKEAAGFYGCESSLWSRIVSGERAFDLARLDKFPQEFCQELSRLLAERYGLSVVPTQRQEDAALSDVMAAMMRWITVHERRKTSRD